MSRANALAIRTISTWTAASATGLTALDSTTKAAFAAWIRIPVSATGTGDILFHADLGAPGNGLVFRTATTDSMQVTSLNGSTATQLQAPRALGTVKTFRVDKWNHWLAIVDSAAGVCRWYVNGRYIGNSTTGAVAWAVAGTRTTAIGTFSANAAIADVYDLRHWAQNDADICIASPAAVARLAMIGRPAGESIRLLALGPNGLDASGNARHLAWTGAGTIGAIDPPKTTPDRLAARRIRRIGFSPAPTTAFVQGPSAAAVAAVISPAITVQLSDNAAGVTVTLANQSGPGSIGGTLTATSNGSGLATFSNITEGTAGTYTLVATAPGHSSIVSPPFLIGGSLFRSYFFGTG